MKLMEDAIVIHNLSKYYGSTHALTDLNLTIKKGEVFGYLGPNGAGKTTTIRLLLGLIHPTSGSANIFGLDVQREKIKVHEQLAYVPGEATLWPSLTGKQTLYLLGKIHGSMDIEYLNELTKRFNFDPKKRVRAYSKGNKQKINLIAAFATRAPLLVLDEPTNGLDPLMEQAFRTCVAEAKARGQTIFLSSHILEEVQAVSDRIGILREGKLIDVGRLEEMRHLSALTIDATFSTTPPDITHIPGVHNVVVDGNHLTCNLQGEIAPLLGVMAQSHPLTFLSTEPSLEELFLTIYDHHQEEHA